MKTEARYQSLRAKHRRIEAKLEAEMQRPLPDSLLLQRLKRRRLLVKDELESWERLIGAIGLPITGNKIGVGA